MKNQDKKIAVKLSNIIVLMNLKIQESRDDAFNFLQNKTEAEKELILKGLEILEKELSRTLEELK